MDIQKNVIFTQGDKLHSSDSNRSDMKHESKIRIESKPRESSQPHYKLTFKNGNNEGIPRADATTAKARAVVLRTYSSMLSISGLMVEIIVASPAAWANRTKCFYISNWRRFRL